ncbi:MAG: ParB/RepB/Spo0J family partition protein [Patescibacteria group bacterium]|nr:ParB/RepB/Spo0J family partition protein [Patescibacteria group bacterium]
MKGYSVQVGVSLEDIDPSLKPASQMRATLSDEAIEEYAAAFDNMPAVTLMFDQTTNLHWVVDGAHTISAARKLGKSDVPAKVKSGSYHEAFKEAAHANAEHGVRITNADKRHRVEVALADPVMSTWSNPMIADACGVSHDTVWRMRPEPSDSEGSKTIGRDGKARSAPKPRQPREEKPSEKQPASSDTRQPSNGHKEEVASSGDGNPAPELAPVTSTTAGAGSSAIALAIVKAFDVDQEWGVFASHAVKTFKSWPDDKKAVFTQRFEDLAAYLGTITPDWIPSTFTEVSEAI